MPTDIQQLCRQLRPLTSGEELETIEELLAEYPELELNDSIPGNENIWHDLMKQASPDGQKSKRIYSSDDFRKLMNQELQFLLRIRNLIKQILKLIPAKRNKKIVLQVIEYLENVRLETGGGASLRVQRVVMIYNKEGRVEVGKRQAKAKGVKNLVPTLGKRSSDVLSVEYNAQPRFTTRGADPWDSHGATTLEMIDNIFDA